jgi:adenylate cyclase
LFEIVVPAVVDAGGHVDKFLGDGALAVFGAPNDLADHADAAVASAVLIQRLFAERFGGALRIGIGINTGVVIAGTIGGGGKLEFTLIGDTVNVAARVEQLTKTTGDAILLTDQSVDALASRPPGLTDGGTSRGDRQVSLGADFRSGPRDRIDLLTTPTPFAYPRVIRGPTA